MGGATILIAVSSHFRIDNCRHEFWTQMYPLPPGETIRICVEDGEVPGAETRYVHPESSGRETAMRHIHRHIHGFRSRPNRHQVCYRIAILGFFGCISLPLWHVGASSDVHQSSNDQRIARIIHQRIYEQSDIMAMGRWSELFKCIWYIRYRSGQVTGQFTSDYGVTTARLCMQLLG